MGVRMENSLLEQSSRDLASLIDDVVAITFKDNPARFLKAHYVAVDGTDQSLIAFEFDALMFDAECRVALGAMGAESPGRIDVGHMPQPR
jgi:hypothetical protein